MSDQIYMQRCLDLATLGEGNVSPNPMVGCVIVSNNKIVGEGYHQKFGEAHAEVNAIKNVFDNYNGTAEELLKEATVYVSLEPCAHFGKTPPCADLLVKHEVKKVIICNTDPFASVNGKGIEKLERAGIIVETGLLAEKGLLLNKRFFTRISKQRPYLILKWAQTSNGFFAPVDKSQKWITGKIAKDLAHKWRSEEDAILVGKQTALVDNPRLTNRTGTGKNPIRILIDKNLSIPTNYNLYNNEAKTIIFNEVKTDVIGNMHFVQMEDMHFYLAQKIAFQLYLMDIQSVIIEGGAVILNQFITSNLWDEARIFTGGVEWENGMQAPKIIGNITEEYKLGPDTLTIYKPNNQI